MPPPARLIIAHILAAFMIFAATLTHGQEAPPVSDVPELARQEIVRRGDLKQELGTIQSGPIDIMADAMAPPADDSHKWFFTLVTSEDPATLTACDRLKNDINTHAALKAWINVDDPATSWSHYHVRRIEDDTQADWLNPIRDKLTTGGLPALVIQPPRNGDYGPNKTVVSIIHNYDGNADALSSRIGGIVKAYTAALITKGEVNHEGDNTRRPAARPVPLPPFKVDKRDPFQPSGPVTVYPAIQPDQPAPLTANQIRDILPDAPADFRRQQLAALVTTEADLLANYDAYLDAQEKDDANRPSANPPQPTTSTISEVLVAGFIIALTIAALYLYHQHKTTKPTDAANAKHA